MIEIPNGEAIEAAPVQPPKPNTIELTFDPERKLVGLKFDNASFPSWDFVLGVIRMAEISAENLMRQTMAVNMQRAAMEQAQMQGVVRNLKRPIH